MKANLQTLLNALNAVVTAGVVLKVIMLLQNGRNNEKGLSEIFVRIKRVVYAGIISISISSFVGWVNSKMSVLQSANDVGSMGNVIVQYMRIARDTIVLVSLAFTSYYFVQELVLYQFGDENEKAMHKNSARKQLLIGIAIACAGAFLEVIFRYFQ